MIQHLIMLDVGHNQLESVPESIGSLTVLTELSLASNQLSYLPDSIENLINLNPNLKNKKLDMPTLLERVKEEGRKVFVLPIYEYWLDIGKMEDFNRAQTEILEHFPC